MVRSGRVDEIGLLEKNLHGMASRIREHIRDNYLMNLEKRDGRAQSTAIPDPSAFPAKYTADDWRHGLLAKTGRQLQGHSSLKRDVSLYCASAGWTCPSTV